MPADSKQGITSAPQMDVKTGQLINPHNPEFLTKRPWYLQDNAGTDPSAAHLDAGPSLEHQGKAKTTPVWTLTAAEEALQEQRKREQERLASQSDPTRFGKGQWVEALKKNKPPYRICQIVKVQNLQGGRKSFDLQYEDGTIERNVKFLATAVKPRIRVTKSGSRSATATTTAGSASSIQETYDSKRDQYHGYDKDSHNAQLQAKYEQREALRRTLREQEKKKKVPGEEGGETAHAGSDAANKNNDDNDDFKLESDHSDVSDDDDDDDDNDEFLQRDQDAKVISSRLARQGGVGGAQMQMTARNLRIREDTAKYLRNLDPNSAYYDPKSRSMRDNPNPHVPVSETDFAGDNVARISGDAVALASTQLFCWDAQRKVAGTSGSGGAEHAAEFLHPQANPSQAELLRKQFQKKATDLKLQSKKAVLDKYGGQEYLDGNDGLAAAVEKEQATVGGKPSTSQPPAASAAALDRNLRFGVSTTVEQYDPSGGGSFHRPGTTAASAHPVRRESKYQEDVFINGHTTVWGSYFHKGAFQWGYADDHSLLKNSYCTGETGRLANDEAHEMRYGTGVAGSAALAQARGMLQASRTKNSSGSGVGGTEGAAAQFRNRSKHYGEVDPNAVQVDPHKLQDAVVRAKEQQEQKESSSSSFTGDKKKRKYNSMHAEVDVTEEDMEAYRLVKERQRDPMANLNSDELLEYKKE